MNSDDHSPQRSHDERPRSATVRPRSATARQAGRNGAAAALLGMAVTVFGSDAVSTVIPPPAGMAAPVADAIASGAAAAAGIGVAPPTATEPPAVATNDAKSDATPPSAEAWKAAAAVTPQRAVGEHSAACKVRQLGHWYNVRCVGLTTSAITQLGGDDDGVRFKLDPAADDGMPREGELSFSLRDEQSRAFSFWTFGEGYDGPLTVIAAVVVQTRRHAGATTLVLHDALNRPIRTAQSELRQAQRAASPEPSQRKSDTP